MITRLFVIALIGLLCACAPKADLDTAQKQISELQSQLAESKSKVTALESQVGSLQAENTQLRAQLERKPELPVTVSFRKALTGPGYVAIFNTTVKSPISALATLQSAALGTSKKFELHLNPTAPSELGHLEGAVFEQGDVLTLENQGYSPVTVTVNFK